MSQTFDKEGKAIPVTLVRVDPMTVTQIKTKEKDGYNAVQIASGIKKHPTKPLQGHIKKAGLATARWLREYRGDEDGFTVGQKLDVSVFAKGDKVRVSGTVKGRGFQGVVKRHGFHGAPATHGTKHAHREPGSVGATWPQRIIKGKRMAGRMGGNRVTVKNLTIADVLPGNNLLILTGAVPGHRGSFLEIKGI